MSCLAAFGVVGRSRRFVVSLMLFEPLNDMDRNASRFPVGGRGTHAELACVETAIGVRDYTSRGVIRDVLVGRARLRPSRHWHSARTEARPPRMPQACRAKYSVLQSVFCTASQAIELGARCSARSANPGLSMPFSTDVNLPRTRTPVFPDRCVTCGLPQPGRVIRVRTNSIGWWTIVFWSRGAHFSVEAPACEPCRHQMIRQRWVR